MAWFSGWVPFGRSDPVQAGPQGAHSYYGRLEASIFDLWEQLMPAYIVSMVDKDGMAMAELPGDAHADPGFQGKLPNCGNLPKDICLQIN